MSEKYSSRYITSDIISIAVINSNSTHFKYKNARCNRKLPFIRGFIIVLILFLCGATAFPQDKTSEIDRIFGWASPGSPGCVCAVSQNGKQIVNRAYGLADLERNIPITTESVFDVGSLIKQFVAAATLMLVEEGRLSLSEDIRKYLPELPDYGFKITIDHLLTHTSGIRDWTGLLPLASVKTDALQIIMRQRGLNFPPGEEWSYSNSGYVLLKEIISRVSTMPFSEYVHKRIFDPLGMKSTVYKYDLRDSVKNRALAYDKENGKWKLAVLYDKERGGGGALLSTAADLLIWNEALTNGLAGSFVTKKLEEQTQLNNGRKIDYGRGLIPGTYRGIRQIWHTGSAAGYKSWLGRYPESGLSIAILCNSGDGTDRTMFAHRIFDLFAPQNINQGPDTNKNLPKADTTTALNNRAGLYFSEGNRQPFHLVVDRGILHIAGGPALEPITKDRYKRFGAFVQFMSQDEFELQFLSDDHFELKSMEGKITKYHRAKTYTPSPDELKAFEGRYESDEIGSVFQVTAGKDMLILRLEHMPGNGIEFKPVHSDTFQRGMMMIRFSKDNDKKPVALDYSNPLLRNVTFTRVTDDSGRH